MLTSKSLFRLNVTLLTGVVGLGIAVVNTQVAKGDLPGDFNPAPATADCQSVIDMLQPCPAGSSGYWGAQYSICKSNL